MATVLTSVGAFRVSIGPPIMLSVFGRQGFLSALISAAAAKAGTEGWQTASMCAPGPDMLQELDEIVDIVVEIEAAVGERDQLRVAPVGDVDVVAGHHPLDRAAKQGRIMAGHRRDHQQLRPGRSALLPEMLQLAERLAEHDLLVDRDLLALDDDPLDPEFRLAARRRGVGEDFERRGDDRAHLRIAERIGRILHPAGAEIGEGAGPREQRTLHFIRVV